MLFPQICFGGGGGCRFPVALVPLRFRRVRFCSGAVWFLLMLLRLLFLQAFLVGGCADTVASTAYQFVLLVASFVQLLALVLFRCLVVLKRGVGETDGWVLSRAWFLVSPARDGFELWVLARCLSW